MAIRTIEYAVSVNGIVPASQQFGGTQGDHNATELKFTLSEPLRSAITSSAQGTVVYRFDGYDGSGGVRSTEPQVLTQDPCVYVLEEWITRYGGKVQVYLVITDVTDGTEMELYSFPAVLNIKDRPDGKPTDGSDYDSISTLYEGARASADKAEDAAARAEQVLEDIGGAVPDIGVTEVSDGVEITVTSKEGIETAKVYNGRDGVDGKDVDYSLVANALKGYASGSEVVLPDVSPLEHELSVKLSGNFSSVSTETVNTSETPVKVFRYGKNLFDVSKITNIGKLTNNGDGILTISANALYGTTKETLTQVCPILKTGDNIVFSFSSPGRQDIYLQKSRRVFMNNLKYTITQDDLDSQITFYGYQSSDTEYGQPCLISNIQIELGTVVTDYMPYVEPTEYTPNADGTVEGIASLYPTTILSTDTDGVAIECEYNKDLNKLRVAHWEKLLDITIDEKVNRIILTSDKMPQCKEFIVRAIFPVSTTEGNVSLGGAYCYLNNNNIIAFRFNTTNVNQSVVTEQRCHILIADNLIYSTGTEGAAGQAAIVANVKTIVGNRVITDNVTQIIYKLHDSTKSYQIGTQFQVYGKVEK